MISVKLQDTQSIYKYKVYLYMLVMKKPKIKLRKELLLQYDKKYKIFRNKFNKKYKICMLKTIKHY